jgi:hypothetical protein
MRYLGSSGVIVAGLEAYHSSSSIVEVKIRGSVGYIYSTTPFLVVVLNKLSPVKK